MLGSILVGLSEALFLYFTIGDSSDFYVFRYAAIIYGIFGIFCGIGASFFWLVVRKYFPGTTQGRIHWHSLTFILGAGLYGIFAYVWGAMLGYANPISSNRYGAIILGTLFTFVFGITLSRLNDSRGWRFSGIKFNIYLIGALVIFPIILGTISKPSKDFIIKAGERPLIANSGPNIILIIADALRADYLDVYGGEIPTVALKSLAEDGITFDQAFATCSWTRPSFTSILTSLYPLQHGVREFLTGKFPDDNFSLQWILGRAGYLTCGFFNNANLAPDFNFQQDFDEYYYTYPTNDRLPPGSAAYLRLGGWFRHFAKLLMPQKYHPSQFYRPAEEIVPMFIDWKNDHKGSPFFALVHLMEPHDPYFAHPYDGRAFGHTLSPDAGKEEILLWKEFYKQEIMHMDSVLIGLLDELRRSGQYDSTLIIFASDHGEEFYDHQSMNHGATLYNEVLRVPLIMKFPNNWMGNSVSHRLASLIDLAPTIADAVGVKPSPRWKGKALFSPETPTEFCGADLKNSGNEIFSINLGDHKLIHNLLSSKNSPQFELYSMVDDFREEVNLADEKQEITAQLYEVLKSAVENAHGISQQEEAKIDDVTKERLKALGYIK